MRKPLSFNWLFEFRDVVVYNEQLESVMVKLCAQREQEIVEGS